MRFFPTSNSLSVLSLIPVTALLVNGVAAAIDFKLHPKLLHPLLARQSCTSSSIQSKCLTVGSDPSECINFICGSCTGIDSQIADCCKRSGDLNRAQCIANIETNINTSSFAPRTTSTRSSSGSVGSFPTTSSAPAALRNAGCSSLGSKLEACESSTPGFSFIVAWTSQASCFCYSGNSFAPSSFDNYYSSCLRYAQASDTNLYSSLTVGVRSAISTPCADYGRVRTTTSRGSLIPATPGTTPTATGADAQVTSSSGGSSSGSSGGAGGSGNNPPAASNGQNTVAVQSAFALFVSLLALAIYL
ncbi:MAG: hypothetical protein Q9182_003550 [Xanthomendoza sp. 2 TL-2023]